MYLKHISLSNFRLFNRLDISVPKGIIVLVGDNAQGKTSFLEAIHFFSTFTSVQSGRDRELINFQTLEDELPVSRLVMNYMRQEKTHTLEARLIIGNSRNGNGRLRKEVLMDGVKRSLQKALGNFNSVIFLPQMTNIIEGGPDLRRRFLDITISQVHPGYARELSHYQKTVSQRNALLKNLAESGGDPTQLDYWDERIAEKGAFIIHSRLEMLNELQVLIGQAHLQLSEQKETLKIKYVPGFNFDEKHDTQFEMNFESDAKMTLITKEELYKLFLKALQIKHQEEIMRGVTTIGPHRDDLLFFSNEMEVGTYGSRGQIRTVMMALKISERDWLKQKTRLWPVLLLDETMAELDIHHRKALLDALNGCEQAILTATDISMFNKDFLEQCTIWHIDQGVIRT